MGIADQEVTQMEFAEILDLSDRQLRNLKRTVPPSGKRGTALVYKLGPSVRAYIEHVRGSTGDRYTKLDLATARIRKEVAQATKEEALARSAVVQAKRDEEKVVEIQDVREELESIFTNVRARMRAIPSKIASAMAGIVGQEKATRLQRELEEHIDEALAELASKSLDERQTAEPSEKA